VRQAQQMAGVVQRKRQELSAKLERLQVGQQRPSAPPARQPASLPGPGHARSSCARSSLDAPST
jgi:hypothetical protein